ncbi:MAG: hypothetical protein AAFY76_14075 [Cyanobacteria bacterium J06649_11]
MINLYARLAELPKSKYDQIWQAWKQRSFPSPGAARNRFNRVIREEVQMYYLEGLFFRKQLGCTDDEFLNPNFSFAEKFRSTSYGEIEAIEKAYGMTG